jgi:ribosomal protein L11 methyltransferase
MNYISYLFHPENEGKAEQLIALLSNQGFEGFEEEPETLKAFIAEDKFDQAEFDSVIHTFPSISYEKEIVENINWNAAWESGFEPVIVHDFAAVRASFHQPVQGVQHEIIITPKMSFGTGHHATTFLMIEQMAGINFIDKKVLDFGTGTGVLAILAEKMGANSITAIDNDDWSIENAKENITANDCHHIILEKAESIITGSTYDIILANINLNVILANLEAIQAAANAGATILLSGFLSTDGAQMKENLEKSGFIDISIFQKGDWLCISCKIS